LAPTAVAWGPVRCETAHGPAALRGRRNERRTSIGPMRRSAQSIVRYAPLAGGHFRAPARAAPWKTRRSSRAGPASALLSSITATENHHHHSWRRVWRSARLASRKRSGVCRSRARLTAGSGQAGSDADEPRQASEAVAAVKGLGRGFICHARRQLVRQPGDRRANEQGDCRQLAASSAEI
jgi:hypothetical protein